MSTPSSITPILLELELLLGAERQALKRLDADEIEQHAVRKLELLDALTRLLPPGGPSGEDALALSRIRDQQLTNQLLLVHLRDCVRGVISVATGAFRPAFGPRPSAQPPKCEGARLHIQG